MKIRGVSVGESVEMSIVKFLIITRPKILHFMKRWEQEQHFSITVIQNFRS